MIAAAIELGVGTIATLVIVWVVTQAAWAVGSAIITLRLLRQQTKGLGDSLSALSETVGELGERVQDLRQERTQCELRAARQYASRAEFAQTLAESASNHREILGKLSELAEATRASVSKAHGRIDKLTDETLRAQSTLGERITAVEAGRQSA